MKKVTLLAAMAMVAGVAAAQYAVDPTVETVLSNTPAISTVHYIALDETALGKLEAAGAKTISMAPNDEDHNLYVWDGTYTAGDGSYPGVGDHFDGYLSLVVANVGWSGAGYNIMAGSEGVDVTAWTDDTHFHLGYMSPGTVCPSVALVVADQDNANTPARIALGESFNDNGTVYTAVAPACTDDWQGIDLTFAQLKKLCSSFAYNATTGWTGNIMSFLCGGTEGQTIAFDAVYFYTPGESGVKGVSADNSAWVVTRNTVNYAGANSIALYDLNGKMVKKSNGSVLGLNGLATGVYVARSGKAATKVVVK